MYLKKANLHIHTLYSDGAFTPRQVIRAAKKRGFGIIAITDHNEIRGSLKAFDLAPEYEMVAFLGAELFFEVEGRLTELLVYFREKKDIVAFFNEFRSDHFIPRFDNINTLIKMVKRHNGASIAPHPYAHKGILNHGLSALVDGYEMENSFIGKFPNTQAEEFAKLNAEESKFFGAADMHLFRSSLNCAYTELTSKKEIDADAFWNSLLGKSNEVNFRAVGGSLPYVLRLIQEFWCLFKATAYLAIQDYRYTRLHNFHNFKRHHNKALNAKI